MPSLMDELRSDQRKQTRCATCIWLEAQPPSDQKDWDAALADRSFTAASIHRALQSRGAPVGRSSVETHRSDGHRR